MTQTYRIFLITALIMQAACTNVQPWERGNLAKPQMALDPYPLQTTLSHPNKIRGASTISQQTAKNIFLFQGGGFLRKGPEVFFTFTIETIWTKRMILERYLNCIEMGPGIFGVQAAAKTYFNKNARELSRTEAAQIAACLPNPKRINARGSYALNRAGDIVRQMGFLEPDPDIQDLIK